LKYILQVHTLCLNVIFKVLHVTIMAETKQSLTGLFLSDKAHPGTGDASEFSLALEKVLLNQKLHLQSLEVIKLWVLIFLFNMVPNQLLSCGPDKISHGYFEVLNDTLKIYYYPKNDSTHSLKISSFSFENKFEHIYPESDEKVPEICSVLVSSEAKTLTEKHANVDFTSYTVSLIENIPLVSVTFHKCDQVSFYVISESNVFFEAIKLENLKQCEILIEFSWSFETWNALLLQYIRSLFVFVKPSMVAVTGFVPDSNSFLVTALIVFLTSHQAEFRNVTTEIQLNSDGDFVGIWVQLASAPLMFLQYAKNLNLSSRLAAHTIALTNENYLQYEIYHEHGTFMLRIREKIQHSILNFNQLQPELFLYQNQLETFLTAMQGDLFEFHMNCRDLDTTENYLLGRFLGDQQNANFYNIFTNDNYSTVTLQSFAYVIKFGFTDDKVLDQDSNCNITFFHGRILPYYVIQITNSLQKSTRPEFVVHNATINLNNHTNCNAKHKLQRIKAIEKYSNLRAEELFNCPECLGKIVMGATKLKNMTFQQTKSLIIGLFIGMFPVHSFMEKSLVIHKSDDLESCYQVEFETKYHFSDVQHTVGFWKNYAKTMNLAVKVHIVVIVLSETSKGNDKSVSLDSICLEFVHSDAKRWKFGAQMPNDEHLPVLSLELLPFVLTIDNRPDQKPKNVNLKETVVFGKQFSSSGEQNQLNKVNSLIVYAQMGANLAFGVREKLAKLGYTIRTDYFDKISQIRANQIETKNSTIAIPDYLIGSIRDLTAYRSNIAENVSIPEEKFTRKREPNQLIASAEQIGAIDLEIHVNKVALVNGMNPKNTEPSLTKTWKKMEADQLQRMLKQYNAKTFDHVKFLTVPDIHSISQCNQTGNVWFGTAHTCDSGSVKSQHTMIDMTKRIWCTPELPIDLFQHGIKVESFHCSDDGSNKQNTRGFPNENMFSISKTYTETSLAVISLAAKMSQVLGKIDSSNIFLATEGFVSITGSPLDDVLVLPRYPNKLQGFFDGKGGKNTLLILHLNKWIKQGQKTVIIDSAGVQENKAMKMYKASNPKEYIRLLNIQKIIGREEQQEKLLNVGCHVEFVHLKGGYRSFWDEISIPKLKSDCNTDLNLILDARTEIFVDAQQNRYIEYTIDSGPVKITVKNSSRNSVLGLIVVEDSFLNFDNVNIVFETDRQSRNISFSLDSSNQTPYLMITNVSGRVQVKFEDFILIMDSKNHTIIKNQQNQNDDDQDVGFMSNWKLDDKNQIITYTFTNGTHYIDHNLLSLDEKTTQSDQYIHVYEIDDHGMPVTVTLDETQSSLVNVLDLRALNIVQTYGWGRVQLSAVKSTATDQCDEIAVWIPDDETTKNESQILAELYLTMTETSTIFVVTETVLVKLKPRTTKFKNVIFEDHLEHQKFIVLDSNSILDMFFGKMVTKIIMGEHRISRAHGNLIIEEVCEKNESCSSSGIIFWNYDQDQRIFDKVANLPGWINS